MSNDVVWITLVLINILGFMIRIERPLWLYDLEKWASTALGADPRAIHAIDAVGLLVTVILVAALRFVGGIPLAGLFLAVVLISTSISLFKLTNALVPPQRKTQGLVRVEDALIFSEGGEGSSREFIVMKVFAPELGVRVLPACPYATGMSLSIGGNVPVLYRRGSLGLIYRFSFDSCFW